MSDEKVTISFQVPRELHERANKHAAKSSRSLAGLSRHALMMFLCSEEAEKEHDANK